MFKGKEFQFEGKSYQLNGSFDSLSKPEHYPKQAPRYQVGDWVYDNLSCSNIRVVSVTWSTPWHGSVGEWRVSVPGHGAPENHFSPAMANKPYVEYERVSECSHRRVL